ncbi:fluoride efflux transporter CrcB [Palleronia pelagia]|uniref:Fluoride-specific ion channel FluC n=1 Tax=Palleronia pelagia TaxID=387096 RepID=A0A1H8DYW4_9RHOB|nr:fluoride efflux transporter CrcB [Palleronia pelagia]SEN12034.1 CrcB protein [Palleronia pelagia]
MLTTLLQVMAGGALGAGLRWGWGLGISRMVGPGFPLPILTANVFGSFLMGLFVVMAANRGLGHFGPFVQVGLLGGFTTFSSFSLEAVTLMERGEAGQAAAYILLSVGASIGGLFLGLTLGRGIFA